MNRPKKMENHQIRLLLQIIDLTQWELADLVGVSETTISRWFRKPLTHEQFTRVMEAIHKYEGGESDEQNQEEQ